MKVKFVPNNIECEIKPNESVLHVAHNNGIHIKSVCKGVPSCAECRIKVVEGEYNLLQPSAKEISLVGNTFHLDGRRLSCQLKCFGDITVDLSEQIEKAERVLSGKRPRAGAKTADAFAAETSSARHGNIILDEDIATPAGEENALGTNLVYEDELIESEKKLYEEEKQRALRELKNRGGGDQRGGADQRFLGDQRNDRGGARDNRQGGQNQNRGGNNQRPQQQGQGRGNDQRQQQGQGRSNNRNDQNRGQNQNQNRDRHNQQNRNQGGGHGQRPQNQQGRDPNQQGGAQQGGGNQRPQGNDQRNPQGANPKNRDDRNEN